MKLYSLPRLALLILVAQAAGLALTLETQAQEATKVELAGGKLSLQAPATWKKIQPKSNILQYEFIAPADAKPDEPAARITISQAGGSIDANIDRWYGQFEQPDGKSTKEKSKTEKFDAAGQTVHWVDIPGTFKETMGGPFAGGKTVLREDYRMLGAIIVTKDQQQIFIKITGPTDLVEKLSADFKKSLQALEAK
jgi:hypothetical protein